MFYHRRIHGRPFLPLRSSRELPAGVVLGVAVLVNGTAAPHGAPVAPSSRLRLSFRNPRHRVVLQPRLGDGARRQRRQGGQSLVDVLHARHPVFTVLLAALEGCPLAPGRALTRLCGGFLRSYGGRGAPSRSSRGLRVAGGNENGCQSQRDQPPSCPSGRAATRRWRFPEAVGGVVSARDASRRLLVMLVSYRPLAWFLLLLFVTVLLANRRACAAAGAASTTCASVRPKPLVFAVDCTSKLAEVAAAPCTQSGTAAAELLS